MTILNYTLIFNIFNVFIFTIPPFLFSLQIDTCVDIATTFRFISLRTALFLYTCPL